LFRYLRLLVSFARISFRDMSEFRLDFFTSIGHYLIYQAIFFVFWKSILGFTADSLGDWQFPELVILSSFTLMSMAAMLLFTGFVTLYQKVLTGSLDKYLCRPVSPLFGLLAEDMRIFAAFQQLVAGLLIVIPVCIYYELHLAWYNILAATVLLIAGSFLIVLIQGCLSLSTFWFGDVSRIQGFVQVMGDFEKYPINLFPGWLQAYLTWILPIGLISTCPVLVLLGKASPGYFLMAAFSLMCIWGIIFKKMWGVALTRYESFGG